MELPNGVYEKILTPTDIIEEMSVPSGWVGEGGLLPAPNPGSTPVVLPVMDENGRETILRLAVRSQNDGEEGYNLNPVFMSREWHAFVVEKGLREGDRIYVWCDRGYLRIKIRVPPCALYLFGTRILC